MKMFKLLRRQVACERTGRSGELETVVYEETYVPDPEGTIVLLNPDDANRVVLTRVGSGKIASGPDPRHDYANAKR